MPYNYDRTAGSYDREMTRLVQIVDRMTASTKHAEMAKRMATDILNKFEADPGTTADHRYGIKQYTDGLKAAIDRLKDAASDVGSAYDELNRSLLRSRHR